MAYIREYSHPPPPRVSDKDNIKISFEVQWRQSWQLRFEVRKLILYWLRRNVVPNFPTSQTLRGEVMWKRRYLMLATSCVSKFISKNSGAKISVKFQRNQKNSAVTEF